MLIMVLCRVHIVSEFNGGNYDIIIAADELATEQPETTKAGTSKKHKK